MKIRHFLSIIILLNLTMVNAENEVLVNSPSESLCVIISETKFGLKLKLSHSEMSILESDICRFVFNDKASRIYGHIQEITRKSDDKQWPLVYGERSVIPDRYNEVVLTLTDHDHSKNSMQLMCRVYDEGIAFRYLFSKIPDQPVLKEELTSFIFDDDYKAWVTGSAQGAYRNINLSAIEGTCERPLVIEMEDSLFLALGEAALIDFARMKFMKHPDIPFSIQTQLAGKVDLAKAGYVSPWRYVMVADSPGKLLENNYFILNLNEPNKIEDVSWIKPGKVIREVTLTTQGGMACVDFASRHNLQFIEFDAGWYGSEYDGKSDASTITVDPKRSPGPLDLPRVIDYADQKGIGIILYVNRRALEKQLDEILPLYKSWGIKGLKYGFVNVGSQMWTSWLHDAVRKAAGYQLMVDIHDEYRPTGYSRTFPNLMTQEGIRGDEESPSTEHTLITLFTRMIAGAGDNTNCYYASRVVEKMGGKAAQMAKAVMLYSPWQFLYWYDRPNGSPTRKGGAGSTEGIIKESEELRFYDALPTIWDETKVLEGKIGEYATIARRNGTDWFLGSLTANHDRNLEVPLNFLEEGYTYEAIVYSQDIKELKDNQINNSKSTVTCDSVYSKLLVKNSGVALHIKKL